MFHLQYYSIITLHYTVVYSYLLEKGQRVHVSVLKGYKMEPCVN